MAQVPDWFFHQSAVVPYRRRDGEIEVLLVTTVSGKRWIVPKGVIDPGETAPGSAAREAEEEAGVRGTVHPEVLGTYRDDKWGGTCTIRVFAMAVEEVLEDWPEKDLRRRRWRPLAKAAKRVGREDLAGIIRSLADFLE
jgi:8-oxo-dGTP pyrophosphatase MutT (NUDIX family)